MNVFQGLRKKSLLNPGVYVIVVVLELHQWQEFIPVILLFINKDLKALFQFLVTCFIYASTWALWVVVVDRLIPKSLDNS